MKVYVTMIDDVFDDEYEGRCQTRLDTVWSTLEKAQKRLIVLMDDNIRMTPEDCLDCNCKCESEHECFYDSIDDADPNKIIVYESSDFYKVYYIQERRIDTLLGEREAQ